MQSLPIVAREVFQRYAGCSLPRHVSYPMPTWWREVGGDEADAIRAESARAIPTRDLSLYLHLPFCEALCKFCACNRTVMKKTAKDTDQRTEAYVAAIEGEIRRLGDSVGAGRPVRQIHWGGGTPTYLSPRHIERLHTTLAAAFSIAKGAELAIEIDPRVTSNGQIELLRRLGFNRVSLGVQDFDERVQKHIHRVQPFEMVKRCTDFCRDVGFPSVNFDLIYGMPYQTIETVTDMIDRTIMLSPDRVAYYHYAQIPEKIANQRGIHHDRMPDSNTKLTMFLTAVELFTSAGYEFIGLDHFAKPDEVLAQAAREGTIDRNFQGMTTGAGLDLIGVGASSISQFGGIGYLQNVRDPDGYVDRINDGVDPVIRGTRLTRDDCIRQAVINHLYCYAAVERERIEDRLDIDFNRYFADELERLKHLEVDGLVVLKPGEIELTYPLGRVLMRNVAAVFDGYLDRDAYRLGERHVFSDSA
ncbi:MAG: oxygen-independent coproporphyrinogen III oxidase [Myxococcota bacterium]